MKLRETKWKANDKNKNKSLTPNNEPYPYLQNIQHTTVIFSTQQ